MTEGSNPGRAGRMLSEALVVVFSILVAFALDAAWDDRELARELDRDMASVAAEIETNIESALIHIDLANRVADASSDLLERLDGVPEGGFAAVPDTVVWWNTMTPTFEASLGAVDALVASGRMSAIDDRELSRRLASLRSRIDDAVEEEYEAQTYFEAVQAPVVFEHVDFSRLSHVTEEFVRGAFESPLETRGDFRYPNSPAVRSALEYRRYLYLQAVDGLEGLIEELDEIKALLDVR